MDMLSWNAWWHWRRPVCSSNQKKFNQDPNAAKFQQSPGIVGTNTLAILSLVFAFIFPILGIILGHFARSQIRKTGEQGDGMALTGLIVGYLSVAITAAVIITVMMGFG